MPRNFDDDDDTFEAVSNLADRMGLKGERRTRYIHDHMTQAGYRRVVSKDSYRKGSKDDDDDDDNNTSSRWFGGGGSRRGGGSRSRDDDSF